MNEPSSAGVENDDAINTNEFSSVRSDPGSPDFHELDVTDFFAALAGSNLRRGQTVQLVMAGHGRLHGVRHLLTRRAVRNSTEALS